MPAEFRWLHLRADAFYADRDTLLLAPHLPAIDGLRCPAGRRVTVTRGIWTGGHGGYYRLEIAGVTVSLIGLVVGQAMFERVQDLGPFEVPPGGKLRIWRRGDEDRWAGRFELGYLEEW